MCGIICILKIVPLNILVKCAAGIQQRGEDGTSVVATDGVSFVFARLSVMDVLGSSMQPLTLNATRLVYNGEIYNATRLVQAPSDGYALLHALDLHMHGPPEQLCSAIAGLNGEFAGVAFNYSTRRAVAFRDPTGVRPLFVGRTNDGQWGFASEAKALLPVCTHIEPFPPNTVWVVDDGTNVYRFPQHTQLHYDLPPPPPFHSQWDRLKAYTRLACALRQSVRDRIHADRPIGCYVSGGLDSTVTAYLTVQERARAGLPPPQLFTVAFPDSTDVLAARRVARVLGLPLHEVQLTVREAQQAVPKVVWALESACITTVRASVPQYLCAQRIRQATDVRVLISGEGSDELFGGYMYMRGAPTAEESDAETLRLVQNLYLYDNLRVDRTAGAHSLEVRIPFLDKRVIRAFRAAFPLAERGAVRGGIEKRALRAVASIMLPHALHDIVWRTKEALSDGVGYGWVDAQKHTHGTVPAEHHAYQQCLGKLHKFNLVPHNWMPKWSLSGDPSARFLSTR